MSNLESEISEKANKAPRVTPADIEANIASEFFFTAAEGVLGASEMGTRPAGRAASKAASRTARKAGSRSVSTH